jgi:hypothetical protein
MPHPKDRFVERFEAREIELDDDNCNASMRDTKLNMAMGDDKAGGDFVHAI